MFTVRFIYVIAKYIFKNTCRDPVHSMPDTILGTGHTAIRQTVVLAFRQLTLSSVGVNVPVGD